MRGRSRGRRFVRSNRGKDWLYANAQVTVSTQLFNTANTACQWLVAPSVVRAFGVVDPTLIAIRTFMTATTASAPAGAAAQFNAMGLIAWRDRDDIPPAAADAPGPLTDGDLDWIGRWVGCVPSGLPSPNLPNNPNIFDITHLNKAKRKLGNDTGILVCFQSQSTTATGTAAFAADFRLLLLE